jgi:hypothetical protein
MAWQHVWQRWGPVAGGAALCGAAYLLNRLAWHAGYRADYATLLLYQLRRFLVLLLAWWAVFVAFTATAEGAERPAGGRLLRYAGGLFIVLGCMGVYPLWFIALFVLALWLAVTLVLRRRTLGPGWKVFALRAGVAVGLFVIVWYQCGRVTEQALYGLRERIEATGGSEKLLAWVAGEIAATPPRSSRLMLANEAPGFVREMTGRIPGWPVVWVSNTDPPSVAVANGSGYGYLIILRPTDDPPGGSPAWLSGTLRWRRGVYLGIASK